MSCDVQKVVEDNQDVINAHVALRNIIKLLEQLGGIPKDYPHIQKDYQYLVNFIDKQIKY